MGAGRKLKMQIVGEGIRQYEIADHLGWREGRLSNLLNERKEINRDQAKQIREAIKTLTEKRAA